MNIVLSVFFLILSLLPGSARGEIVDRVIAIVNDDIITLKELEKYVRVEKEGQYVSINEYFRNVKMKERIDVFIDDMLVKQQAKKLKIEVFDKDVELIIENIKRQNLITELDLKEQLAKENISYKDFFEGIRTNTVRSRVLARVIAPEVTVSESTLKEYYTKNIEEFKSEEYKLQQIFISIQRDDSQKRSIIAYDLLKSGKPFEAVAKEYSDEPSGAQGGDIGFVKGEELMPVLRQALRGLLPGMYTSVIRTPYGFHILRLVEQKKGEILSFEALKDKIHQRIVQIEGEKKYKEYIQKLRKSSYIEVKI